MNARIRKALVPVIITLVLWLIPTPEGLPPNAWKFFALFMGVISGLVLEPIPIGLVGFIGITIAVVLKLGPTPGKNGLISSGAAINWGLSGFSNSTVWLIFVAFMFAAGYEKTGLGRRVALFMVNKIGRSTIGLGYAIVLAEVALAPFMPSNTARSGGTLFPVIRSIPTMFNSLPDHEPRKIGAYLSWVALAGTCLTSSMFITGSVSNPLSLSLLQNAGIANVSWMQWYLGFLPVGLILFALIPLLTYWVYPPTQKGSDEVPRWASGELKKMGAPSKKELIMAATAFFALILWVGGSYFDINATTTALLALIVLILTDVLTWDDFLSAKRGWDMLAWVGTLVAMASGLKNTGFLAWCGKKAEVAMVGADPLAAVIVLVLAYFFVHYFFASLTAHATALLTLFVATGAAIPGVDAAQLALLLCFSHGIMGILTPYGTGPSPIWYGAGYISSKAFWGLGALFGTVFVSTLVLVGIPWLRFIG